MSDETTLLPCPFCGGEAELKHRPISGSEDKGWFVRCRCSARIGLKANGIGLTKAEAIAAWNARATGGKLTAEQVMDIAGKHQPDYCSDTHVCFDWQAIADELNARAERTCKCIAEYAKSPIDGKTIVLHRCSACHELMRPYMRFCPSCGAKVVGYD